MREIDVALPDGRVLHAYQAAGLADATGVCWHHGTSNLGAPPEPLMDAAAEVGLRWFSLDRPGYGGSTPVSGRTVGSVAADAAATQTLAVSEPPWPRPPAAPDESADGRSTGVAIGVIGAGVVLLAGTAFAVRRRRSLPLPPDPFEPGGADLATTEAVERERVAT